LLTQRSAQEAQQAAEDSIAEALEGELLEGMEEPEEEMDDEELLSAFKQEVDWAIEARERDLANDEEALDYFYGRSPAPPSQDLCDAGQSSAVSLDVQNAVYAVTAEIMPALGREAPVEFQPLNEQDTTQTDQETRTVNHVAQTAGIARTVQPAVQDVLLRRAGVVKVYWEERLEVSYETANNIPAQMALQRFQQALQDGAELEMVQGDLDETAGTVSGVMRLRRMSQKPVICHVPRSEFLMSADVREPDPDSARLVAHQRSVSRSELVEMGFDRDKVDELSAYEGLYRDERGWDRSAHESTEPVMMVEGYYRIDRDGDGIAELRRIITAGGADGTDMLMHEEPWGEQPFSIGVGYIGFDTWDGVSLFDRLKSVQDLKTSLLRDSVNTVKRNMRQRLGLVEGDANTGDAMDAVAGGYIRMKTPNGIVPVPDTQLPGTVFQLLGYLDEMLKDQGGGAVDATASAQVLGQGGDWSLERLMAAVEQLNAMVAKSIVETLIKPIYRKLHALLREHYTGQIEMPTSQGWVSTNPMEWNPRTELVVSMGMSVGERGTRIGALQAIKADHAQDQQTGMQGIMSSPETLYRARVDLLRLSGIPNPEQYYIDPSSPQAQKAIEQAQQAAQQQAQEAQQQAQQTMQFQYSLMTDIERVKAEAKLQAQQMADEVKKLQAMLQQAEKMFGHRKDLAIAQADLDAQEAQRDIDAMQAEAERKLRAGEALTRAEVEVLKMRKQGAQQ